MPSNGKNLRHDSSTQQADQGTTDNDHRLDSTIRTKSTTTQTQKQQSNSNNYSKTMRQEMLKR
eukprot:4700320-Amphidinium_carterae.1